MQSAGWAARVGRAIVRVMLGIAMLALVGMMLVVVADVVLRQALNFPIKGAYDAVSMLLCISVFYAIGAVIAGGQEIVIDLIDDMVPPRVTMFLRRTAGLLSALVLIFIFYAMFGPARDAWRYGDISLELRVPVWWIWVAALVGLAGGIIAALLALVSPPGAGDATGKANPE